MLSLTRNIREWHSTNQFRIVVIYGVSGIGKSVYALKVLKEVYEGKDIKPYILFRPRDFVNFIDDIDSKGMRVPVFLMDDAGVWFNNYDFKDPFVIAALKWIQVARSNTSCILFTTPNPHNLVKSLRSLDSYYVRIKKYNTKRIAKGYFQIMTPRGQTMVVSAFEDLYDPILDNDTYSFYKGIRNSYATEAKNKMKEALSWQKE